MSDAEKDQVKAWLIKASVSIAFTCLIQIMAWIWFMAKLDSKVLQIDNDVRLLVPRVETLERDYWKRGGGAR